MARRHKMNNKWTLRFYFGERPQLKLQRSVRGPGLTGLLSPIDRALLLLNLGNWGYLCLHLYRMAPGGERSVSALVNWVYDFLRHIVANVSTAGFLWSRRAGTPMLSSILHRWGRKFAGPFEDLGHARGARRRGCKVFEWRQEATLVEVNGLYAIIFVVRENGWKGGRDIEEVNAKCSLNHYANMHIWD